MDLEDEGNSKKAESDLNITPKDRDEKVNLTITHPKLGTRKEKSQGVSEKNNDNNEIEGSSGSNDNTKVTTKGNAIVKRLPQLKEIEEEEKEGSIQNDSVNGNPIQVAKKNNEEESTSSVKNVQNNETKKFAKIKMDMPTALQVMGYSHTLISDGEDPRSGLQCALLKKMSEIQTRKKKPSHSHGYRYTTTKARNDLCQLHEAYQFLSYKISIMKSMASNSSNIESESGEEKNSNLFGLDEQKASERGAKVRPKSSSLSNRKLKNSTAIRPKSVPKSAHSNNKKKVHIHK
ncbi:uncharacterized protein [Lepeophtheirus salmonis]|uniref:uncharacterized protein n=1 Tax=Lepeophtheirus salmonis TaxID=72036 RepID=UPI003AF39D05